MWVIREERTFQYHFEFLAEAIQLVGSRDPNDPFLLELLRCLFRASIANSSSSEIISTIAGTVIDYSSFRASPDLVNEFHGILLSFLAVFWRCVMRLLERGRTNDPAHLSRILIADKCLCAPAREFGVFIYERFENAEVLARLIVGVIDGDVEFCQLAELFERTAKAIPPSSSDVFTLTLIPILDRLPDTVNLGVLELILLLLTVREGHHTLSHAPQHHSQYCSHLQDCRVTIQGSEQSLTVQRHERSSVEALANLISSHCRKRVYGLTDNGREVTATLGPQIDPCVLSLRLNRSRFFSILLNAQDDLQRARICYKILHYCPAGNSNDGNLPKIAPGARRHPYAFL
jgi:hypothetical protein